ncbi:hypothetical protein ABTZ99_13745 [Actinosynnema sp. NPDC002837]
MRDPVGRAMARVAWSYGRQGREAEDRRGQREVEAGHRVRT